VKKVKKLSDTNQGSGTTNQREWRNDTEIKSFGSRTTNTENECRLEEWNAPNK